MVNGRLVSFVGTQVTSDLRKSLFRRLHSLSVDYYDRHNVGSLVSRVSYDTEAMKDFVRQAVQGLIAQMLVLIVTGVMLFSISWRLALWTLLPAPVVIVASTFYWRRIYPRYYRVWEGWSRMTSSLSSILSGMRVVKAFGQEGREEGRYARTNDYVRDSTRGVEYTTSVFNPIMGLVFGLGGLIVWVVGGQAVIGGNGAQPRPAHGLHLVPQHVLRADDQPQPAHRLDHPVPHRRAARLRDPGHLPRR